MSYIYIYIYGYHLVLNNALICRLENPFRRKKQCKNFSVEIECFKKQRSIPVGQLKTPVLFDARTPKYGSEMERLSCNVGALSACYQLVEAAKIDSSQFVRFAKVMAI